MKKIVMISLLILICVGLYGDNSLEKYIIDRKVGPNGSEIIGIQVPGGRPPKDYVRKEPVDLEKLRTHRNIVLIDDVPAFDWSYGCSSTSAAMIAAYYDRNGYHNIYTGPTNGGVMPLNNSIWGASSGGEGGSGECTLSATHQGYDGLATRGHVDDYWIGYGSNAQDPYVSNGWTQHVLGDCTGDYMGTNQKYWSNTDASTTFYYDTDGSPLHNFSDCESYSPPRKDGTYGFKQFMESRGYDVTACYSQYIHGYEGNTIGFTFGQYVTEINANRPVLIHIEGHTMVGFGYDSSNQTIYIKNTWDYSTHTMTWGDSYSNMLHYGVSVVNLDANILVGTGTETEPYLISNLNDLLYLSLTPAYWESGVYIEQTANIDASDTQAWNAGKGFSPIGLNINFQGSYNGKGYTISNLYINRPITNDAGLFGNILSASISNVGLVNAQIVGKEYVGGLASSAELSTISNTYVTGSVNATGGSIGGIIGFAMDTTINNSYATCSVNGIESVGGLVGIAFDTTISKSYAIGLVSGSEAVGGLISDDDSNTVLYSFWDIDTTEQEISAGGTGKTTAEMKDINTYLTAGWDFAHETDNGTEDIWVYYNDYPHLSWEGELISE
ncbi:MAG: hypothetical protein WC155_02085, partial [Candidatus Cloacimonadales bacterium]